MDTELQQLHEENGALRRDLDRARPEVAACLNFMQCEMGWEDFREELLCHDGDPRQGYHAENVRKLTNFLAGSRARGFATSK